MIVIVLQAELIDIICFKGSQRFQAIIIFREHIGRKDFRVGIVIEISQIGAHGKHTNVAHVFCQAIAECPVPVIDVEIITFIKVIGNINIRPSILVDITDCYAQAKSDDASKNSGFFAHIIEVSVPIVEKFISTIGVPLISKIFITERTDRSKWII